MALRTNKQSRDPVKVEIAGAAPVEVEVEFRHLIRTHVCRL